MLSLIAAPKLSDCGVTLMMENGEFPESGTLNREVSELFLIKSVSMNAPTLLEKNLTTIFSVSVVTVAFVVRLLKEVVDV